MKKLLFILLCFDIGSAAIAQKKYRTLEGALMNPDDATELILSGSQDYKTLPPEMAKLTKLKVLKMYGCGIQKLSPVIGELKNLEVLELGSNYLKSLPPEICKLTKLRELSIMRNELTELPADFGNMASLVQVDLSNNKLVSLPSSFYLLNNLLVLNLQFNELTSISPEIVRLSKLESLDISRNNLAEIPEKIWFTPNLFYLNMYKCGAMLTIPQDICSISSSSVKPRIAYIDTYHVPSSIVMPKCSFAPDGVRYGWYFNFNDKCSNA